MSGPPETGALVRHTDEPGAGEVQERIELLLASIAEDSEAEKELKVVVNWEGADEVVGDNAGRFKHVAQCAVQIVRAAAGSAATAVPCLMLAEKYSRISKSA